MPTARKRGRQKVSPAAKPFTDARRPNSIILGDIQQYLVSRSLQNDETREQHKIHVSELTKSDFCPRQAYYKITWAVPTDSKPAIRHRTQSFFDTGHEAHKKWQDWITDMGRMWGTWECRQCQYTWPSTSPKSCPECLFPNPDYKEVTLEDPVYPLVGHADGAVTDLNVFLEFKGIGMGTVRIDEPEIFKRHQIKVDGKTIPDINGMWKAINRPFRSHLLQANLYGWMGKRLGMPFDRMVFIYEFKANQDTKEFVIPFSQRLIKPLIDQLEFISESAKSGQAPDRPVLYSKDAKPCSECPFRTLCWGGNDSQKEIGPVSGGTGVSESAGEGSGAGSGVASSTDPEDAPDPRRHNRVGRRRTHAVVHATDTAGGVPRNTVGRRRGGRAVRGSTDGGDQGS